MVRSKSVQGIPENLQPSDNKRQLQPMPSTLGNTSQNASEAKSTTKTSVPSSSLFLLLATGRHSSVFVYRFPSIQSCYLSSTIELHPQLCQLGNRYSSIVLLYPGDGYQTQKIRYNQISFFFNFLLSLILCTCACVQVMCM